MSVDAKDDGKSPPLPPGDGPAAAPGVPAKKPAPPLPPPIGGAPKANAPAPPKPAGGPPKLAVPPPAPLVPPPAAIAIPGPPRMPAASPPKPAAPPPAVAPAPVAPPVVPPAPAPAPIFVAPAPPRSEPPEQAPPLSTPPLEIPMPPAMTTAELDARTSRSTMEFLFELDSPIPTSKEMDLRTMPEVEAAIAASGTHSAPPTVEVEARISMPELPAESVPPPGMGAGEEAIAVETDPFSIAPKQLPRITLRAQPPANTAEEQLEARRRRLITRLVTCRDVFRALGYLEIKEADRKEVARVMMALDDALEPARRNLGVAKDPAAVLSAATKDEIDRVERLVSPIEDKLLALDDLVQDALLASRVDNGKITPKMLARYGRLLVSRRMQAGPRRDRFEWIATALLSRKAREGLRALVGAERATQALELLIGGLPFKPKEQELEEAIVFLTDALERLNTFQDQEAFFDSEYFIDVHGYKVSMRELLLSPDFVYLSVAINVRLHNRVEHWIASMERVHNTNQLKQDGSPRDQLTRRLRQADDAVASIFNAKTRGQPAPVVVTRIDSKAPPLETKKAKTRTSKKPQKRSRIEFDRRFAMMIFMLVLTLGAGGYLAYSTGYIQLEVRRDLPAAKLKQLSPRILSSSVKGTGKNQEFEGIMMRPEWRKLSPTERREEAERIAAGLRKLGINKGVVLAGKTKVIEINDGLVVNGLYEGNP